MELICYAIQIEGGSRFDVENSKVNLIVNQVGEESITFNDRRIVLHNCDLRNLDCLSDEWEKYFSIFNTADGESVVIEKMCDGALRMTKKKD